MIKQVHTLDEAVATFLAYSPATTKGKYQIDRIKQLMTFLGDPQEKPRVIHIAGTSGKTSTAYFVRGLLEAAGRRTGLTVSPHIIGVNERVQIGGIPLEPEKFIEYVNHFLSLIAKTNLQPTYFELLIALAYKVFADEKVEYAVVETGLGGLLDGTNVVSRPDKVCVITDIGLDHTKVLGDTLVKIATQKAGIIQPYNHVIMRTQTQEVMQVIARIAAKQQATVQLVDNDHAPKTLPHFQHRNWAVARTVFDYIKRRDGLSKLTNVQLHRVARHTPPGRWEVYHYKDKTIILDGAHNPQKLQAFCDSLAASSIYSAAVLANLVEAPEAKIRAALDILQPFTSHLIIPEFYAGQDLKSRHSLAASQCVQYAERADFISIDQQPNLDDALRLLLQRPEKVLIISGSLYLVSALRPRVRKIIQLN